MVKGTTRQVIVVTGTSNASFDQAIFLVKDDLVLKGGISERTLLKEAQQACQSASRSANRKRIIWTLSGSAITGIVWLLTILLQ